tara:strand:+ start:66 stop:749 length:684 start_codon:yes stop_codon:yes gene_type:complete
MMKTIISGLLLSALHGAMVPAIANESKLTKGFYTMDAMGCMLLQECTDDVQEIKTIEDIRDVYPDSNYDPVATEFDSILQSFNKVGVGVFLADEKYFPVGHRGVYHTVGNNFFLNKSFMHRPHVLMSVVRHEGWHAAQDCMAGTIENNMIAIIHKEEDVPEIWQEIASHTYASMPHAIPWEKEATWAGKTSGMTENALQACAEGEMWKVYEPTPLTAQWLRENNYID